MELKQLIARAAQNLIPEEGHLLTHFSSLVYRYSTYGELIWKTTMNRSLQKCRVWKFVSRMMPNPREPKWGATIGLRESSWNIWRENCWKAAQFIETDGLDGAVHHMSLRSRVRLVIQWKIIAGPLICDMWTVNVIKLQDRCQFWRTNSSISMDRPYTHR